MNFMNIITLRQLHKNTNDFCGGEIEVCGWVRSVRASKNFGFITVSDGTLTTEAVGKGNMRVYVLQNGTAKADGACEKIGEDGTYLK